MFGEVTGKTKDQLKGELWKMRLRRAKRHIPAIIGFASTVVAAAVAAHYRNEADRYHDELVKLEGDIHDSWYPPKHLIDDVRNGATLKYRELWVDGQHLGGQATTLDEFPDSANEDFDRMRNEIKKENEDDA